MNEILKSPLVEMLKKGQLPVIEVSLRPESVATLLGGLFLTLVAVLLAFQILKKF